MAAALLRSTVGQALRRAVAAPASSSRLSSAAAGGGNTRAAARTYYGYGGRSRYDPQAYTHQFFPPSQRDKADSYFGFAAFLGTLLFVGLMEGEYRYWGARPSATSPRPPLMTRPGRDKPGGFFTATAFVGAVMFACLMGYAGMSSKHSCD